MPDFEFTFTTNPISDEVTDKLLDLFDCLVSVDHSGQTRLEITMHGNSGLDAGKTAHMKLIELGVSVRQAEYDLVSRADIARRLGTTPQAVGNWARGDRPSRAAFPATFSEVSGGVWLWADIVFWARHALRKDPAPRMQYPSRAQIEDLNACFRKQYAEPAPRLRSYSLPAPVASKAKLELAIGYGEKVLKRGSAHSGSIHYVVRADVDV